MAVSILNYVSLLFLYLANFPLFLSFCLTFLVCFHFLSSFKPYPEGYSSSRIIAALFSLSSLMKSNALFTHLSTFVSVLILSHLLFSFLSERLSFSLCFVFLIYMKDELLYKPFGFVTYKKVYNRIDIILYKNKKEYKSLYIDSQGHRATEP